MKDIPIVDDFPVKARKSVSGNVLTSSILANHTIHKHSRSDFHLLSSIDLENFIYHTCTYHLHRSRLLSIEAIAVNHVFIKTLCFYELYAAAIENVPTVGSNATSACS